jgi:RHS repeat-associated protein
MLFGRHIVELNGTNNALVRNYVWGLDLSGTMDGAGGVGGLLWVTLHTVSGPAAGTHFAAYDGNGNVVTLVSATTGIETARYEYGPFGELIRITGPAATLNPFRFSSKRTDNTTDLVLYEYRVYLPSTGSWLSRDPIGEQNENNIYVFVHNDATSIVDLDGLSYGNNAPPIVIDPLWTAPTKSLSPVYPILIPQPPPRIPPSAPPRQPPGGAPTNPGNAAGGAIVLCANMWNDIFNRWEYQDGIKICRSQLRPNGLEQCCVMYFCSRCCGGRNQIIRVSAYLHNKSCAEVQAIHAQPGPSLKPGCPEGYSNSTPAYESMW